MRADFQQYYGLNLDGMGTAFSYSHAAFLCAELPSDSRIARAYNPDAAYTLTDLLLRDIEHDLRILAWQRTEDAKHRRNFPEPLPLPSTLGGEDAARKKALENKRYVDSILNMVGGESNG